MKKLLWMGIASGMLALSTSAQAGGFFSLNIGLPPVSVHVGLPAPPVVHVRPPAVRIAPPRVVLPAPPIAIAPRVVVAPPPVVYVPRRVVKPRPVVVCRPRHCHHHHHHCH